MLPVLAGLDDPQARRAARGSRSRERSPMFMSRCYAARECGATGIGVWCMVGLLAGKGSLVGPDTWGEGLGDIDKPRKINSVCSGIRGASQDRAQGYGQRSCCSNHRVACDKAVVCIEVKSCIASSRYSDSSGDGILSIDGRGGLIENRRQMNCDDRVVDDYKVAGEGTNDGSVLGDGHGGYARSATASDDLKGATDRGVGSGR